MQTIFAISTQTADLRRRGYFFPYRPPFGRDLDIQLPVNHPARPDPT